MKTGGAGGAILAQSASRGSSGMEYRLPSHEELVDLSWLLDSALVVGDRRQAIELASRLIESLGRHQKGMAGEGGPTSAARRHCVTLSADVMSVLTRLRRGDVMRRVEFRHRVQALAEGRPVTNIA